MITKDHYMGDELIKAGAFCNGGSKDRVCVPEFRNKEDALSFAKKARRSHTVTSARIQEIVNTLYISGIYGKT